MDHHLGDAVSAVYDKFLFTPVDQWDFKFTTIVGIDCADSVHQADSALYGKSAARSDLGFISFRQFQENSRRDEFPLARLQNHRF